ncbi:MAG TPA: OstA-like protein, partial [Saprospiraceae bacterium]|nr:OstA-like protein [Saprospiraceae bacterium]HMQ85584.1 OstA-like protein [Saprospiraceae bacterium]
MLKNRKSFCVLGMCLLFAGFLFGQQPGNPTTKPGKKVDIDHADVLEYFQFRDSFIQKLNGHVELRQDSVFMYCDTAIIKNSVYVTARWNVIIQQGDSLSIFADSAYYDGSVRIAELFGEVILVNGERQLFTDRLTYDLNTKLATYNNGATVVLEETQLTSKKGYYYVNEKQVFFKDSVVVIDPQFNLRADTLGFNTETRVVDFLGPTLITNDSTRVYCEDGYYDTQNNLAQFTQKAQYLKGDQKATADTISYDGGRQLYTLKGNAQFTENDRVASADVIEYDEANDKTLLLGSARYKDAEQNIVAESIIYDAANDVYSTRGRSRISNPPQILEADQVDYSQERGIGLALGNVIWQDTSAKISIFCQQADYDRKKDYLKAMGSPEMRPLLITVMEDDSLYMSADTLLSFRVVKQVPVDSAALSLDTLSVQKDSLSAEALVQPAEVAIDSTQLDSLPIVAPVPLAAPDTIRHLLAYYDVRIYKSDMQALCDSLSYSTLDSTFRLWKNPIVWSDTSQFVADTVNLLVRKEQIDKIYLRNNAFIINSPDELFFNQIKGKFITAFFKESELRRMDVNGNAQSIYYALDEGGGYVGVNQTVCSEMVILFDKNEVQQIKFLNQPQATMNPMGQVNHETLKLSGFAWRVDERPAGVADLRGAKKVVL